HLGDRRYPRVDGVGVTAITPRNSHRHRGEISLTFEATPVHCEQEDKRDDPHNLMERNRVSGRCCGQTSTDTSSDRHSRQITRKDDQSEVTCPTLDKVYSSRGSEQQIQRGMLLCHSLKER
ncbi:hypothetical protein J6590_098427, partial [Homalodisca vitripennis]